MTSGKDTKIFIELHHVEKVIWFSHYGERWDKQAKIISQVKSKSLEQTECILKAGRDKPNTENYRSMYFPYRNNSVI